MTKEPRRSSPALKLHLADIAVAAGLILLVVFLVVVTRTDTSDIAFDPAAWRADDGGSSSCSFFTGSSARTRMVKDASRRLLEATPKPGKPQVEAMLGEPNASRSERLWSYRAGASTMDCLTFDVAFDEQGLVVDASLRQH